MLRGLFITLAFIVSHAFLVATHAQNKILVTGTVKDSAGARPLAYATVELFAAANTAQPVQSVVTNSQGVFSMASTDTGRFYLVVSFTGYNNYQQAILLSGRAVHIGEIKMNNSQKTLEGVVIQSRKPLIEQSDDKIVFNVENDPAAKTESAIDLLRKTPFVSVDGENNVSVNGQTNFRVLLNGRETAMFAQNVKEALKGFPGAVITKIEVITTPSAKYDAEGVGGIINIITKKKVAGYNGSLNTWYTQIGWYNVNANFSAKYGRFGMSVNYGAGGGLNVKGVSRMETLPTDPTAFTRRLLLGGRTMTNFWNFGNAELNYELDSLRTISVYGNVSGGWNKVVLDQTITTSYKTGADSVSYYDLNSRNQYPTTSVGADLIRKFRNNKEREFSLRFNTEFGNSNTFLNSLLDNPGATDRYIINNSLARNTQYTLQTDYVHPLKNNRKIEGGLKAILRRAHSDFESRQRSSNVEDYKLNTENTDFFNYNQDVYSAYGSLSMKKDKTTFRLGGRVEHTEVDGSFAAANSKVLQSYTNFLPNLQATTRFSNAFTMVLTYSDRIQRPFIQNLNPFRNNNDPRNISFGNPNLEPQVIHNFSVQTRFNKGATFVGLTFTGSYSNNMIVQYASYDKITGITSTTSGNVGEEIGFGANGNINTKITKDWTLSLNGFVRYSYIKNKMQPSQVGKGYGGNANLNSTYTINKRLYISSYAGFFRAPIALQTTYPLNLWYGIQGGYKFFNDKLSLSFGLSNFFQKERDWITRTVDPAFTYTSTSTMPFRGISFSINWNFGKLSENMSKKKGVNNDDLLSSGNNN